MKIDRLIGILTILLQQDRVTAAELARRFEVSKRTINRDIEHICKAGVPVVTAQGHGGGISIADGYKLEKTLVTPAELQAILAGIKGVDSVSRVPQGQALLEKLSGRRSAAAKDDVFLIDLSSFYQEQLTEKIELIKKAISARRTVTFQYCHEKGEGPRRVEPYRLIFRWAAWYLLGYCLDRQDFRLFKLNRLWALEPGGAFTARAVPPESLNFDGYFSGEEIRLKAVFHAGEKYRLIEEYGADSYTTLPDGKLYFERGFVSYQAMRQWVFSFGDRVRVLAPRALVEDRREQAAHILEES